VWSVDAVPWTPIVGGIGLQNAWVNPASGYGAPSFRLSVDRKHVELGGGIKGGANGSIAFTLPVGYRPTNYRGITAFNADAPVSAAGILIDPGGNVSVFLVAAGSQIVLDECTFPIDL
jgi:hypothetical protein